ncbi:MAG: P-II family nitrogen regulator [Candidatus Izemoplasmatales bacterium]|jgi:nitrogen regulatory protein PII/PII-like signaling protein|nr:P-II family nitrogen regulator [Candidatus Izemoplasmatales bacterium]MDD5294023.1 P-II family nitrogen regulator [Candidatus Izemoplasmatales bacterium]
MHSPSLNHAIYVAIVPEGRSHKVIKCARLHGLSGATVFQGIGSSCRGLLHFFGLDNVHRDIIMMIGDLVSGTSAMHHIAEKLQMHKSNHGIIYSSLLSCVYGCSTLESPSKGVTSHMSKYQAIYTVIDKGKAELVIDAAAKAGANGGTVINARGSGIHERETLFSMSIEPEKELVLVIAQVEIVPAICAKIREELHIDDPGMGIIFVQDIHEVMGLYSPQ